MLKFGMRALGLLILALWLVACGKTTVAPKKVTAQSFQEGKEYQVIASSNITPLVGPKKTVEVQEFFSYDCPACYHFEADLKIWCDKKPDYVRFERIPVIFQASWEGVARAYYIASMLGVEQQLTPAIFKAIHVDRENLSDPDEQKDFFVKHGISQQAYESMANFSPGIDAQLLRSNTLMQQYQITSAPTLVVDSRYKVDPSLVSGDPERFLQVVDYLIEKVRKGEP